MNSSCRLNYIEIFIFIFSLSRFAWAHGRWTTKIYPPRVLFFYKHPQNFRKFPYIFFEIYPSNDVAPLRLYVFSHWGPRGIVFGSILSRAHHPGKAGWRNFFFLNGKAVWRIEHNTFCLEKSEVKIKLFAHSGLNFDPSLMCLGEHPYK